MKNDAILILLSLPLIIFGGIFGVYLVYIFLCGIKTAVLTLFNWKDKCSEDKCRFKHYENKFDSFFRTYRRICTKCGNIERLSGSD